MIAHLLGNGPSRSFYSDRDGFILGTNLSDSTLRLDASVCIDKEPLEVLANKEQPVPAPFIIPTGLFKFFRQCQARNPEIKLHSRIERLRSGNSSGHNGLKYLIDHNYKEIHVWGCDSIFHDHVKSDTHAKVPRGIVTEKHWERWRKNFIYMMGQQQNISFIIHSLKDLPSQGFSNIHISVCNP